MPTASSTMSRPAALPAGWRTVLVIVGAGVLSALQVGKVSAALGALQASLAIGLSTASWLLSAFSLVGAVLGMAMGLGADAWGARRVAVFGLLLQGLCSCASAATASFAPLLALRVVEGLGFLAVVVAAPSLIAAATNESRRPRAFAAWGTFMPFGVALAMLCAPLLSALSWQALWLANGLLLLAYVPLLAIGTRGLAKRAAERRPETGHWAGVARTLAAPGPRRFAILFMLFTSVYFSVFGFLPTILAERLSLPGSAAGPLAALVVGVNALGNLWCGRLLARGVSRARLLAAGFLAMLLCAPAILSPAVPGGVAYALCTLMSVACGLIPVALIDGAPAQAPMPSLAGTTMGLVMQGNNAGLVLGPAVAGAVAGAWGWSWVAAWTTLLALAALLLIHRLR